VTFESVFLPMLDLSHTVAISGAYLDCKGKVSAITHVLDIDSGSAISRVGLSLSRRNGSGTVSDDPLTAPAEPTAPDEMAPDKTFQLGFHLGGNEAKSLPYSESWESPGAYITNYTANTSWQTSDFNPAAVALRYTEGFFVTYPDIDSTYTNEANEPGAVIYEVDVPEDDLTITA
jgi:hypothetical protein